MEKNIVMLIIIFISDVISLYYMSVIFQKTLKKKFSVQNYCSYIFLRKVFPSLELFSVVNKKIKKKRPKAMQF